MSSGDKRKAVIAGVAVGAVGLSILCFLVSRRFSRGSGGSEHGLAPHSHNGADAHTHTHGKHNKASDVKVDGIRPVSSLPKRGYTKEELSQFDGVKNTRIFVSLKRKVYEVAPQFYGPGAAYHIFAGKEASRCLAKSLLDGKDANKNWVDCTEEELETLDEYVEKFESKYPVVGWFIPDSSFYEF